MAKKAYFSVQSADRCIWLNDLRGKAGKTIHLTKSQAKKVGKELMEAGEKADYGKGQNVLI